MRESPIQMRFDRVHALPILEVAFILTGIKYAFDMNFVCPLPQHIETVGSARFFMSTNTWSCYGCKSGGGPLELVCGVKGISRMQALDFLEREFELDIPTSKGALSSKMKILLASRSRVHTKFFLERSICFSDLVSGINEEFLSISMKLSDRAEQSVKLQLADKLDKASNALSIAARESSSAAQWNSIVSEYRREISAFVDAVNSFIED